MSKRTLVTLLVTFKLLAMAASAAIAPQSPLDTPDINWGEECQPWEGCDNSSGS
jgi:hypothetical protein